MSFDTYDNLKTEIINWLSEDDVSDYVDSFIATCEANLRRNVRIPELMVKESITVSDGDRSIDLTTDLTATFQDLRYLRFLQPASNYHRFFEPLRQLSLEQLTRESTNLEGRPQSLTVYGSTVEFDIEADQDYTAEVFFWKKFTALSDANATNEILDNHPDLYLWGSLTAAAPFLDNDDRIQTWGNLYSNALAEVKKTAQENNLGGPLKPATKGMPPSYNR